MPPVAASPLTPSPLTLGEGGRGRQGARINDLRTVLISYQAGCSRDFHCLSPNLIRHRVVRHSSERSHYSLSLRENWSAQWDLVPVPGESIRRTIHKAASPNVKVDS